MAETVPAVRAGPSPELKPALLPAPPVDLGRAVRLGAYAGLAAVFLCAIGMVGAFEKRLVLGPVSLSYLFLAAVAMGFGYLAGRPRPQLEGFAPPTRGPRNLLAGLLVGAVAGLVLAAFAAFVGRVNVRPVFPNISPELVVLLTFRKGLGAGAGLILLGATALGLAGGALNLPGARWRKPPVAALLWVVLFGMLQSLVSQVLRGAGLPQVLGFLYEPGGALGLPAAAVIAGTAFALHAFLERPRVPLRERIRAVPPGKRGPLAVAALAVVGVALAMLPQVLGPFLTEVLNIAGIFVLMALGLNIVVGFAGLLDLGYVAFFAVGAYSTAVLTSPGSPGFAPELTFWSALPFVILAAAVSGLMVGTPVLRMRGDYLAIVTLGFGEIARLTFLSDALKENLGGAQGIINIPGIEIGPFTIQGPQTFFYAIVTFVLLAAYVSYALQDSRIGRAWIAMREDENVAEAMGVNIVAAKLWAFVIGAVLAALGGGLFAVKIGSVFPHSFNIIVSITVLVVIIVGGLASMPGVVVGALVLVGLPELLREFESFKFLLYGALLIVMMLKRPEGFIPSRRRARELREEEVLQDDWMREEAARQEQAEPRPAEA